MAVRVYDLRGVAGVLAARHLAPEGRDSQSRFYDRCKQVLAPVAFSFDRADSYGEVSERQSRQMCAGELLSRMKICHEETDTQTKMALKALRVTRSSANDLLTCANILALFNGQRCVKSFVQDCEKRRNWAELLAALDKSLKKVARKAYFTTSFDRPTAKKGHEEEIAAARKAKVRKIVWSKSKLGAWKGGKGGKAASRRALSLFLASQMGPLLARNSLALLEIHCRQTSNMVPSWVAERRTLLGPGALFAENVFNETFTTYRTTPTTLADYIADFDRSKEPCNILRRMFQELSERSKTLRSDLVDALFTLEAMSDSAMEFMLCEVHKMISFVITKHGGQVRAGRRAGSVVLVNVGSRTCCQACFTSLWPGA